MKIISVIGARPQFIKEAVIQREIRKHAHVNHVVIHTGQHYDENMSGIFFEGLDMKKPQYNLGIHNATHGEMTGLMLIELEKIFIKEKPDWIIVYGDTNSTLAAALAASKLKLKVAHIEAGLRQEPKDMPEEVNRVLTDRLSTYLFAPSQLAIENLKAEGLADNVFFTGDVMYDLYKEMEDQFQLNLYKSYNLKVNEYIVMTLHRDFNVDSSQKLRNLLTQINKIAGNTEVVFPIHPRTRKRVEEFNLGHLLSNVKVIDPLDYIDLMSLTASCKCVITDSGGYQKEAYFNKKKSIVVMPDTSWRELVDIDWNKLTEDDILSNIDTEESVEYINHIYGKGTASKQIVDRILGL